MKTPVTAAVVFSLLLTIASSLAWAQSKQRVALVIGNSKYLGDMALKNPVNDANLVASALTDVGFHVFHREDRTKTEIEADIKEATSDLAKGDVFIFFFAGHGLQIDGLNYLLPIDAEVAGERHVKDQCIEASFVLNAIKQSGASMKVVVLDCCRNNPFKSQTRGAASKGLAKMSAPEGTVLAFSTAPGTEAADGRGDNSPFTKHLVESLKKDYPSGLDIVDWFRVTARGVKKETGQLGFLELGASMDPYLIKTTGIAMLDQSSTSEEFKIEIHTLENRHIYNEDETLTCKISASADCFVSVFAVDPKGDLTMLVPNKWHPQGLQVKGGETTEFPTPKMGFEFYLKPPHGRTLVKAIATGQPLEIAGVSAERLEREAMVNLGNTSKLQTSNKTGAVNANKAFDLTKDYLDKRFNDGQWATSSFTILTVAK